ncbi:CFI-box-CTERM domain-containing protein [Roseovarius salis]|uniref:CFI-box-CTERM domain-containing protein n=1 Tax=Roseovarius salis TaxID=3376063 RepID=UPI0037C63E45
MSLDRRTFSKLVLGAGAAAPLPALAYNDAACTRSRRVNEWLFEASYTVWVDDGEDPEQSLVISYRHEPTSLLLKQRQRDGDEYFRIDGTDPMFDTPRLTELFNATPKTKDDDEYVSEGKAWLGVQGIEKEMNWWMGGKIHRKIEPDDTGGPPSKRTQDTRFLPESAHVEKLMKMLARHPEDTVELVSYFSSDAAGDVELMRKPMSINGYKQFIGNLGSLLSDLQRTADPERCEREESCFLTTACCDAFGRPDDGFELSTLRRFRDGWLARQPGGAEEIETYYRIAPHICAAIGADPRGRHELRRIYGATVLPCVVLVRLGLRQPARSLYRRLVKRLQTKYGVSDSRDAAGAEPDIVSGIPGARLV